MSDLIAPGETGLAEVCLPCAALSPALEFYVGRLGFRVETIFPAEEPTDALLSGHGLRLRLAPGGGDPGHLRLLLAGQKSGPERLVAPNGTVVDLAPLVAPMDIPPLDPGFVITRQQDNPGHGEGRAGMLYRDLIPGRLGGRFIASHIAIPRGGPVADWVHYHRIRFQMIFVRKGWVRVVYEDQGEPFVMQAGDCVLQPPQIRHRVLESSDGLEVIEVGCPALHETIADHDLVLPTGILAPDRDFDGQRFMRHRAAETPWVAHGDSGFLRQDTAMRQATGGLAEVMVLKSGGAARLDVAAHQGELLFMTLLEGSARLDHAGQHDLRACDAFVIPAGQDWALHQASADLALLQVSLPGPADN